MHGEQPPVDVEADRAPAPRAPKEGPPVILQVLPNLVTGGAERGCVDMAIAIQEAGGIPLVASEGGPMVRELDRAGIRHVTLPLTTKNPWKIRKNADSLERIIAQFGVDIVHARSRAPAWSAYFAAKRAGVPFMTTFHAPYNFSNRLKRLYNSVMVRGERVIAISEFIRDHIISNYQVDPSKIRLIHRGIDIDAFDPEKISTARLVRFIKNWNLPEDRPIVLLPARLTRWKGQLVMIDALAKLGREDLVCLLVGSDQGRTGYREELEREIREHGLQGVVRLTDHCAEMPVAYRLATVVVSPAIEPEAFGRVIVEAQAMGKPVIISAAGACRETVLEGETGWVVPPGDADALADALDQALSLTPERLEEVGQRARAFVESRFTKTRMCEATLGVYAELLGIAPESEETGTGGEA